MYQLLILCHFIVILYNRYIIIVFNLIVSDSPSHKLQIFTYLFLCYSLMCYILTAVSFLSSPSSPSTFSLSQSILPPVFLQKRAGLASLSTKHSISSCNKTRHFPSYWGWMKQSSRRKWVPKAGTVRNPTRRPNTITYMQRTDILIVGSVSASPYEPRLVDSVSFVVVSLTPVALSILLPSLLWGSQAPPNVWLWVSASVPISCWVKPLWWQLCSAPVYDKLQTLIH